MRGTAAFKKGMPRVAAAASSRFRIGYVPLVDAAPLIVGQALGFFASAGVNVELSRELGWGSVREKIAYGELDGAQMPGGLLFSLVLGTHAPACCASTDFVLNLQGNAITLSRRLWEKGVRDARTFRLVIRSEAPKRISLAVVTPFSSHLFLMREWLRSTGLDPDRDARFCVLPPPLMVAHMREGQIDGFCVGEPWNSEAALAGDGWVLATSGTLAPNHPEKVLAMRDEAIKQRPGAYLALRGALLEACRYCDQPENRAAVADILLERQVFRLSKEVLRNSLVGPFHTGVEPMEARRPFISFFRDSTNRATRARAMWCLEALTESHVIPIDPSARRRCLDTFTEPLPAITRTRKAAAAA